MKVKLISLAIVAVTASLGGSQPPTPTTVNLPGFTTLNDNGTFGEDGGFTNALGSPGSASGWTRFIYGNASPSSRFRINAPSTAPVTVQYWTATPGDPNTSAAPLNFDPTAGRSWEILSAAAGSSARIQVTTSNGATTYLPLNNTADLTAYNVRLNEVMKFDSSEWYDPNTGAPISESAGRFSFSFSNFDASFNSGEGQYRSISLVFQPVPEPTTVLLVAAGTLGVLSLRRKVRRASHQGAEIPKKDKR